MAARWSVHHRGFRPCGLTRRQCAAGPPCDGSGCQEIPGSFWDAPAGAPAAPMQTEVPGSGSALVLPATAGPAAVASLSRVRPRSEAPAAKAASPRRDGDGSLNPRFRESQEPGEESESDEAVPGSTPGPSQDAALFEGVPMDTPEISGDLC